MIGDCKQCGFRTGIFGLKKGLCKNCRAQSIVSIKAATHNERKGAALPFKDTVSAFEYACEFLNCDVFEGARLPALVVDVRKGFGVNDEVKTEDDGFQTVVLRIASDDGGFLVSSRTVESDMPRLKKNDLVSWQVMQYLEEMAKITPDPRFGWGGVVVGKLKPEWREQEWVVDKS